jgi:hypothetical protein
VKSFKKVPFLSLIYMGELFPPHESEAKLSLTGERISPCIKLNIRQHNNISKRMSDAEGSPRPPVRDIDPASNKGVKVHSG